MMGPSPGADAGRPPYLSHFALREAPFAHAADSRFFYPDPARQQCLDMLQHLAEYSQEWLLVKGPSGVGKSRMLAEFSARSDAHMRPCRMDGKQIVDGAQLFLHIAGCFGLDLTRLGAGNPLEVLCAHLNALHTEQVPVVAVDDAERLSDDALEIILHLADLEGVQGKLVRVVLFAQPALQLRLGAERFRALSAPHVLELHPFDEGHTARYLVHRMSVAGYEGPNPFEAATVRQLFRETGGLPGRINAGADQLLREQMAESRGQGDGKRRGRVILPAAALATLAAVGFAFHEPTTRESPAPADTLSTAPQPEPERAAAVVLQPAVAPTRSAAQPPVAPDGEPSQMSSAPEVSQGAPARPEAMPAGLAQTAVTTVSAAGVERLPAVAPNPAADKSAPAEEPSGADWLKAREPEHFTLQLLAASRRPTLEWFLKAHPPEGPYAVVETRRNGAPLHLLVAGDYQDLAAARAAARRMRGVQAWPRAFGELQSKSQTPGPAL